MSQWMKSARKGTSPTPRTYAEPKVAPAAVRTWSEKQRAIFEWFKVIQEAMRALVVIARAGTGKTTTIIEAVNHAPEDRILLAAFNKSIAEELKARISNPNAEAKTLHGVGFSIIRSVVKGVRVEKRSGDRAFALAKAGCNAVTDRLKKATRRNHEDAPDGVIRKVAKLHSKAREMAPYAETPEDLRDIAEMFECEPDGFWALQGWDLDFVLEAAIHAMEYAADYYDEIDFADMIYLPLRNKWAAPQYDLVVVDEAQDMNRAQLDLAQAVLEPEGRMVLVGDDKQAIYAFRGADSNSLGRLKDALQAGVLPLNVTYRCGKAIVERARMLVADFEAGPSNSEGLVDAIGAGAIVKAAKPGDFILSRLNAPLARLALDFIRNDIPAEIKGRDIADGLRTVISKVSKKNRNLDILSFSNNLDAWCSNERARLLKLKFDARAALVEDQTETLAVLCEGCSTVGDLEDRLHRIFTDDGPNSRRVLLSSVHKAKGLEADRVFILDWTIRRSQTKPGQNMDEERNIEYVAITRAKSHLTFVHQGEAL